MKKDNRTYRLLVIEDNPGDYVLIEDYLDEYILQCELTHCTTFRDAKAFLQAKTTAIDLILLDLSLPDLGGEMLIEKMLQLTQEIPIVALTGFTDMEFSIRSLSMGVSDYLLKDELTATILYKSIVYNIERAKNLRSLRASEQRYSDLFHLSPLPMYVFDFETRQFLDVNNATLEAYGYSEQEFMQLSLKDIRPEDDAEVLEQMLVASDVTFHHDFPEIRHKRIDGSTFYVKVKAKNIRFENRDARLVLAIDVTEERDYIRTIETQNENLRSIAWMQSHVVRAPLARLMSLASLAQQDPDGSAEYLPLLLDSANELDAVIHQVVEKTGTLKQKE
ncbi:MAG: response regulator [Bacteroidia bacterium]